MMVKLLCSLCLLLAGLLCFGPGPVSVDAGSFQEDETLGQKLYVGHCAGCHGIDASGGRGPALNQPWLLRQSNGRYFFNTIRGGIEGGEMPAFPMISDNDTWLLIQYIRSRGAARQVKLPGDPANGKMIFYGKGACVTCHIIKTEGASSGPELSDIGGRRSSVYLRDALIAPEKDLPPGYQVVTVTLNNRKTIRGVRVNEDTFTIQLRDMSGRFHSFRKDRIAGLKRETSTSTMPSYKTRLTQAEIDDVVAFMASLRDQR